LEGLRNIANTIKGMYVAVFLIEGCSEFYAIKHGQPLVIGIRKDQTCIYVSSDLPSLYGFAEQAIVLDDNQVAVVGLNEILVINAESGEIVEELSQVW